MAHETREAGGQPVVERVAHLFRRRIAQGRYAAGQLMPTERELAQELGVSRTSISRALALLAEERLVEQRVGSGTRVRPDARALLPPGLMALVCPFGLVPPRPEAALLLRGAEEALARLDCAYQLVLVMPETVGAPPEGTVRAADLPSLTRDYGAFLFIETGDYPEQVLALHRRGVPVVVANLEIELAVPATWVNHYTVACRAVRVLAALGHRRIGLVITSPDHYFYARTLDGYRAGLTAAALPYASSLVTYCRESSALEAYRAAQALLAAPEPPTAIVAGRDVHAEGIYHAACDAGLVLGHDLSLIGYDDVSWPLGAEFLTTFREPCGEMGAIAAEMLAQRLTEQQTPLEQREIDAPLILRRSIGVAPDPAGPPCPVTLQVV